MTLDVPARFRRGVPGLDEEEAVRWAVQQLDHICEHLGLEDLGQTEVLDVGCGDKFTQALLGHSLPIRRYVGVDIHQPLVEYLRGAVGDPRFEYHYINTHNALYNPDGEPLTPDTKLPVGSRSFDLICLISVFTHMEPRDTENMLHVLRRYIRPDGRLFFSIYIYELTEKGHGLMDALARRDGESVVGRIDTFKDMTPDEPIPWGPAGPLVWAVYSERFARKLIEGAGWKVETLSPPEPFIQHHFVCSPA
jgi:SAM-dependent methyltransferase